MLPLRPLRPRFPQRQLLSLGRRQSRALTSLFHQFLCTGRRFDSAKLEAFLDNLAQGLVGAGSRLLQSPVPFFGKCDGEPCHSLTVTQNHQSIKPSLYG